MPLPELSTNTLAIAAGVALLTISIGIRQYLVWKKQSIKVENFDTSCFEVLSKYPKEQM
jgi:hypothetical protein